MYSNNYTLYNMIIQWNIIMDYNRGIDSRDYIW